MALGEFFARELAPSHRRFVEAARNATKTTLTVGLATSLQILGPFGPLFAFRIGQPGVSLGLFEGGVVIACAAAMQAAIVPVTGKLLDYPGLLMAFMFAIFFAIAYLLSNIKLFLPLALVAVGTITTVYVGIFQPGSIGWGSTYTFDGILVATLVMVALDTYVWPSPPEPKLLESIAEGLESTRKRFESVGRRFLDASLPPLPPIPVKSRLAPTLALLNSVKEHSKPTPQRLAVLLDTVMASENLYLEVERLAVIADEPVSDRVRNEHRQEIESALAIIDSALAERIDRILGSLPEFDGTERRGTDLDLALQRLSALSSRISSTPKELPEMLNFLGFARGLQAIAHQLDPRDGPTTRDTLEAPESEDDLDAQPLINPSRVRFSIKLGATITLGLLVGLTTQRADLQTILWSIAVAGQPNQYGAVARKTILRLAGCIVGGLAALAAMIVVSQNFDSLLPYLIAIFAITAIATYVAQSSEWLGYAGIQTGITFLICYVGLAPSSDIYKPLWRFWGIVLGVLTTGFVFLFLLPEYASDKVIEGLAQLTRTTLTFAREVAEGRIKQSRINRVERLVSANLLEILNLADQARLEGQRGAVNSAAGAEAAATLVRIAYRLRTIAHARIAGSEVALSPNLRKHCATLGRECCLALESNLGKLESLVSREPTSSAARIDQTVQLASSEEALTSEPIAAHDWPAFEPELESYRRLSILLAQLDASLSKMEI